MASYTSKTLAPGEQVISINKNTKWGYANALIQGLGLGFIVSFFNPAIGIGLGAGLFLLMAFFVWYARWTCEFAVTSKKIVSKRGLIARATDELMLTKVEGVDVDQPMLGRILGYGSLKITGPGQQVVKFLGIDNPVDVKNQIQSQI